MRLANAFFAKFADLLKDDTVAMLGGCFDAIALPSFPCVLPFLSMVVRIHFDPNECGPHRFQLRRIVGPDGQALPGVPEAPSSPFTASIKPGMRFDVFTSVMQIGALNLPASGVYRFVFAVDDVEIGTLELDVLLQQPEVRNV